MQLRAALAGIALAAGLALHPAQGACLLAIPTPGVLGLSADGKTLSSTNGLASIIEISNVSLAPFSIQLSNLRLVSAAGVPADVTLTGSYSALTLAGPVSGTISSGHAGVINLNLITGLSVTITLHNTAHSLTGFRQGTYSMKTSVTCT